MGGEGRVEVTREKNETSLPDPISSGGERWSEELLGGEGNDLVWRYNMYEEPYIGPLPGNVDILVHFTKVTSEPNAIRNMDPNRFGVYDAHDAVNQMAKDMRLPLCYPFSALGYESDKSEFWLQPLSVKKSMPELVDETVHESVDVNLNDPVKQSFGVVDGERKEPVCEEEPITENDEVDRVYPSICPNEVYVSDGDDDMNYVQPKNEYILKNYIHC
ncbi:hypothetical protein E2542_SST31410 [Spatholobus suberectus]|nr:hypothetical protein E2542_SST31410 [Spatholobus suberectus]